jgi:hypothetical protein
MTFIDEHDHAAIAVADRKEMPCGEITVAKLLAQGPLKLDKFEKFGTNCHVDFHAAHSSGTRSLNVIDCIVLHDTEGGTANSVAKYFTTQKAGGSAHLVVDDNACYRVLTANFRGFHIEQCGFASWSGAIWSSAHRNTLLRAAWKTAYHCRKYGIRPYFLTADKLKAGKLSGVTTHAECTKAFGGSHTDPGTGWPRLLFMTMVRTFWTVLINVRPAV